MNINQFSSFINLEALGICQQHAASNPSNTAESSHLTSAWPNWHRNPYEQHPFFQNPLHFLALLPEFTDTLTSQCFPWANLHLRSQGQHPSSSQVLQSSVLCLRALVRGQKNSSSRQEELSDSLDRRDAHSKLQIFEKLIELLFKLYNLGKQPEHLGNYGTEKEKRGYQERRKTAFWTASRYSCSYHVQYKLNDTSSLSSSSQRSVIKSFENASQPMHLTYIPHIHLIQFVMKKEEMHLVMLKGQRYKYEGYPEWYEHQLIKNQPISISKFQGNIESAAKFYFKEVNKLYFANTVLTTQLNAATEEKILLAQWIQKLQETQKESYEEKKKRVRRCASQIERKFICQVPNCDKSYGTEGSMAQHMRLKHPEIDYNGICYEVKQIKEDNILPKIKQKEQEHVKV